MPGPLVPAAAAVALVPPTLLGLLAFRDLWHYGRVEDPVRLGLADLSAAAGIMPGGCGCPRYWWDSPG